MAEKEVLTPQKHKELIEVHASIRPRYCIYASAFKRVMEQACEVAFPQALVQSRAKTVSSYAEKLVRKFPKREFTDLCGGRVIVQTTAQVNSVVHFVKTHFNVLEEDDKVLLLGRDKVGYRDMHLIVQLKPECASELGFTEEEIKAIGDFKAEIQVRTWVEHAWADTLHDRIYKNKLEFPDELHRTAALLAALAEESDRNFAQLADSLDGLIANYSNSASRSDVEKEIGIQQLIFDNEPKATNKPMLALGLARLEAALGHHGRVVELLTSFENVSGAMRSELLLALGYSLCKLHQEHPVSTAYLKGLACIEQAVHLCDATATPYVTNLRKLESQSARAHSRLAWALDVGKKLARRDYHVAHEKEPTNPYYLSGMLGCELRFQPKTGLLESMRGTILAGIRNCREHAKANIELPFAYFTAGRLSLLAGQGYEALGYYALGVRYCSDGTHCVEPGVIDDERLWIEGIDPGLKPTQEEQDVLNLLDIGKRVAELKNGKVAAREKIVLIISGGADSMTPVMLEKIRPMLENALETYTGTVISGGTTSGVPGCVGDVAEELKARGKKAFKAIGYLPTHLRAGVSPHMGYDDRVPVGRDFLPEQILKSWTDLLDQGVRPEDVVLLGFGGGALSAVEYRLALGLGATAAIVSGSEGAADELLKDPLWSNPKTLSNLYPVPFDSATIRAFVVPADKQRLEPDELTAMAKEFHARYCAGSTSKLPSTLRPWDKLAPTFQRANREQALYAMTILEAAGFEVCEVTGKPTILTFTDGELEQMAELEHGRWNIERLEDDWRPGKIRDDSKKLHDCLVAWKDLPDGIKKYDRDAVNAFSEILATVGLEVRRT